MRKGLPIVLVLLGLLLIGGCMGCNIQRTLVAQDEDVKAKWGEVQNQYQRRADLVPNLVATVKGAANFEQETLTNVINARAKATSIQVNPDQLTSENIQKFQAAQGELSQALGRLLVVTENYPELKANQNFLDLQAQLEGTENRIAVARKAYNESVQTYNTSIRQFPNNLFSSWMGFKAAGSFTADPSAQNAPKVDFE